MFYHLIIEKYGPNRGTGISTLYLFDLSEKDVKAKYCSPYLNGEQFRVNGYVLTNENILRFQVKETKDKAQSIADKETSKIPPNVLILYTREDIVNDDRLSKDVTNAFLSDTSLPEDDENRDGSVKKSVFIVHGRDHSKVPEIENFVRSIGYEPIVLFKEIDMGDTIIEKIEKNVDKSCYGIVLYTGCDMGYPLGKAKEKKPRARQNVVFEHGYLIGKFGRKCVCALVDDKRKIELPGDLAGVVYTKYDEAGAWKYEIAKNMKAVGMKFDFADIR